MTTLKKAVAIILSGIMAVSFVSCSAKKNKGDNAPRKDEAAINQQYDQVMQDINSDGQKSYEGLSFNTQAFSSFDYSFYPPSDETAVFSLEKNSFGKVNLGGTYFNSVAPGGETQMLNENYKTAKGLSVLNTASEFLTAYAIEDGKALYKADEASGYQLLQNGTFTGKLTAVYGSKNNGEFQLFEESDIRRFLTIRDENSQGMYFDPQLVHDEFPDYKSLAVIDLSVNDIGQIYEVVIYRFEKENV